MFGKCTPCAEASRSISPLARVAVLQKMFLGQRTNQTRVCEREEREIGELRVAGWVARTRPLSEPLSPRGPQPVLSKLRGGFASDNGSAEPEYRVRAS
jgi:hypothetical protein